jgi:hypothetical protein
MMVMRGWAVSTGRYVKVKLSRYRHACGKGERKYNSYTFLTSALGGGEWSASRPGRALLLAKGSTVPIGYEAGWASELVWTQRLVENTFASPGIELRSFSQ